MSQDLQRARKARGMSQDALGTALGLDRATVSRYEAGLMPVPPEVVRPWLDALGAVGEERVRLARLMVPAGYLIELGR